MKIFPSISLKYKFLAIIITLLICSAVVFYFYVNYNFAIAEELVVRTEPKFTSLFLEQGETKEVEFLVNVNNHWLCSSSCYVELTNVASGEVIFEEEFSVSNFKEYKKLYEFSPTREGEGQEIYNFKASCNNIATNICVSSENPLIRNSVVTVNYKLNELGRSIREELAQNLSFSIDLFNLEYNTLNSLKEYETPMLRTNTETLIQYLDSVKSRLEENVEFWRNQTFDYVELFNFSTNATIRKEEIRSTIEYYNEVVTNYNKLDVELVLNETKRYGELNNRESLVQTSMLLEQELELKNSIALIRNRYLEVKELVNSSYNREEDRFIDFKIASLGVCPSRDCEVLREDMCLEIESLIYEVQNLSFNEELFESIVFNVSQEFNNTKSEKYLEDISFNEVVYFSNQTTGVNQTILDELLLINLSCNQELSFNKTSFDLLEEKSVENVSVLELGEPRSICCYNNNCMECCQSGECLDKYPVILLHGHSFFTRNHPDYSTDSFNNLKNKLMSDGYLAGYIISPGDSLNTNQFNDLGRINNSFVFKSTYYSITYFDEFGYITSISKTENIDSYAIRLNEMINQVKLITGKDRVDIVAHSMGGLVTRRYIQIFGDSNIREIILIGTPNQGISDRIYSYCNFFGTNKECEDMKHDSLFIRNLNDPRNSPPNDRMHVIRGEGCEMVEGEGDGIVHSESVFLEGQNNYLITGECQTPFSLHTQLLNPNRYPEVYNIIKRVIS